MNIILLLIIIILIIAVILFILVLLSKKNKQSITVFTAPPIKKDISWHGEDMDSDEFYKKYLY